MVSSPKQFDSYEWDGELHFDFSQSVTPNFINLQNRNTTQNAFGNQLVEKLFTVENGTFDEETSVDEAVLNPETRLYAGFYQERDSNEVEHYTNWRN